MPIRAEHRWLYPICWPQLSAVIRFERAGGRCEHCARSWKIEKLIESAAVAKILDGPTRAQAEALTLFRQRIHAGRMLSDYPGGVPDIKPEESRPAKLTAELGDAARAGMAGATSAGLSLQFQA